MPTDTDGAPVLERRVSDAGRLVAARAHQHHLADRQGLREQLAFPEIDYDKVDRLRGLEVSIVTTARTDEESRELLAHLGMPFAN